MKDRKRGKWTEPPRPVGTKTKVWMIAWEETWEGWKEDRAKNLEKYLAIETKTWFKKKKKTPTRRNMRTSTSGAKGYLETLQKTNDHDRCFDLCQGLVKVHNCLEPFAFASKCWNYSLCHYTCLGPRKFMLGVRPWKLAQRKYQNGRFFIKTVEVRRK